MDLNEILGQAKLGLCSLNSDLQYVGPLHNISTVKSHLAILVFFPSNMGQIILR